MQTKNPFLDDIAKLATGAAGAVAGVRGEMEEAFRAWLERQLDAMDLVTREDFEVVRAMAEKAREENETLRGELEALKAATEAKTSQKKSSA